MNPPVADLPQPPYYAVIFSSRRNDRDAEGYGSYPGNQCGGIYPRWIGERNVGGTPPRVDASRLMCVPLAASAPE